MIAFAVGDDVLGQGDDLVGLLLGQVHRVDEVFHIVSVLLFDPTFILGVVAEGQDAFLPAGGDAALFLGHVHQDVQVAKGVVLRIRGCDALQAAFHPVGEDGDDAQHLGAGLPKGLDHLDGAAAGGDEVLDDDDFRAGVHLPLDPVRPAVGLGLAADVPHGQVQDGRRDGGVGDSGCGGTHKHFAIRVIALYKLRESVLHLLAHPGSGEGEAVVAVDRALDTAGPGERLLGTQENGADGEEGGGYLSFHILDSFASLRMTR